MNYMTIGKSYMIHTLILQTLDLLERSIILGTFYPIGDLIVS